MGTGQTPRGAQPLTVPAVLQESRRKGDHHLRAAPGVPDQPPVTTVPGSHTPRSVARCSPGTSALAPHWPFHPQLPPKRDETALQEEEELQLALALSQSEAEEKERLVSWGPGTAVGVPADVCRPPP